MKRTRASNSWQNERSEVTVENKIDLSKVVVASSQFAQGEGLYYCEQCNTDYGPLMRPESQLRDAIWEQACDICGQAMQWKWTTPLHSLTAPESPKVMQTQTETIPPEPDFEITEAEYEINKDDIPIGMRSATA